MSSDTSDFVVVGLILFLRILVPLLIPRFPLPAILASLVIDGLDKSVLAGFTDLDLGFYQGYDKALDIYYLSIAYLTTMRNWSSTLAFAGARFLYYYRLVGGLLFELTGLRFLLFVFPNTFEFFFIFYEAVRTRWDPRRMSKRLIIGVIAFLWIFIKLPQEWWIHVAKLDATDFIKEHVFGAAVDDGWGVIVRDNVALCIALAVAVVVLIVLARWFILNRLPPADWPFTIDANAPGRDIAVVPGKALFLPRRRIWTVELFEKAVMTSFLCVIFSQVLPNISAGPLQVTVEVVGIVTLNLALSEWLSRRGVAFGSAIRQFVIMAVVNMVIVVALDTTLLHRREDDVEGTLFFVLLLALIITFYDRYRSLYLERRPQPRM